MQCGLESGLAVCVNGAIGPTTKVRYVYHTYMYLKGRIYMLVYFILKHLLQTTLLMSVPAIVSTQG